MGQNQQQTDPNQFQGMQQYVSVGFPDHLSENSFRLSLPSRNGVEDGYIENGMGQNEGWYMDELGQWQKDPYYQPPQADQGQYGNQQVCQDYN